MTSKTPSHSSPAYLVVRLRKILAAKGWPVRVVKGSYSPFASKQVAIEGFSIHKVGCSKSISISYLPSLNKGRSGDVPRETRRARLQEAIEYLRSLNYRVDDRGWIECDDYDSWDR